MKIADYLFKAGVPSKFINANLEDRVFVSEVDDAASRERYHKVYDVAEKIVNDFKHGVLIEGIPGSGKSFLGTAIMRAYLKNNRSAARTTAVEISEWYFKDFQGFRTRMLVADVLFIDDVSRCGGTNANPTVIEKLLKERDDRNNITIYSCDSSKQLAKVFSEPIVRMIKGTTIGLKLPDVDLRQIEIKKYAKTLT